MIEGASDTGSGEDPTAVWTVPALAAAKIAELGGAASSGAQGRVLLAAIRIVGNICYKGEYRRVFVGRLA